MQLLHEQAALRRNLSPALQAEIDTLRARQAELATRREAADPRHIDVLQVLAQNVARLEGELSRKSARFRDHIAPVTIEAVQAAVPENAALLEFVQYHRFDPNNRGGGSREAHYLAYVLQRECPPTWVALGEAEQIEAAVTRGSLSIRSTRSRPS